MGPGETKNNHNYPYSQISQSLMSGCIKNDFVSWASHSSQTRLLSQSTTTLLSCSWIWDTKGSIKQPLTWGNWESQRALPAGACCLELPAWEIDGDLIRRNGQLEMGVALKKALLGRKTLDKVPVVGKDETSSAKQKKRTGEIKRYEKVKGNVCRCPNEMTVIYILSKSWWNTKMLWAVNLARKWSYKCIIQSTRIMSISWAWQTHSKCCKFQFILTCWSVKL